MSIIKLTINCYSRPLIYTSCKECSPDLDCMANSSAVFNKSMIFAKKYKVIIKVVKSSK